MQSADREQFNTQVRTLMGGHEVFPSPDKIEAYWTAFGTKLSLIQFTRIIDHALSEDGPEDMPTVPQMWALYRDLRNPHRVAAHTDGPPTSDIASPQVQLCTYAKLTQRFTASESARPWEYRHREWWVDGKRLSELAAVHILRDDGNTTRITVADMRGDTQGYARMLKSFEPGPRPKPMRSDVALMQGVQTFIKANGVVPADVVTAFAHIDDPEPWNE